MSNRVQYRCPDCGTLFIGEYGVRPVCPEPECVLRRLEEIIKRVEEEKDILARRLQYYTEWMILCNCILYECPNCNALFFSVDSNKLICPTCGYNCSE